MAITSSLFHGFEYTYATNGGPPELKAPLSIPLKNPTGNPVHFAKRNFTVPRQLAHNSCAAKISSTIPSIRSNKSAGATANKYTPIGIPIVVPITSSQLSFQRQWRQCAQNTSSTRGKVNSTTNGVASLTFTKSGSRAIDTIPNPNPNAPCTSPAKANPRMHPIKICDNMYFSLLYA